MKYFLIGMAFCLTSTTDSQAVEGYFPVSIIELVADPGKYLNRQIRVIGYFDLGIYSAIYLNEAGAEFGDFPSAIRIADQSDEGELSLLCDKKYVAVSGRFIEHDKHYEIYEVTQVLDLEKIEPCWSNTKK